VFLRGDARHIPLRASSMDAIVCLFNSFGYFSDEDNCAVLLEAQRVLRPGGRLLIDVLNRDVFLVRLAERTWEPVRTGLVLQDIEYLPRSGPSCAPTRPIAR
jgi:ubiquinone/menaquinone biosynthesis C-methylase UbiE